MSSLCKFLRSSLSSATTCWRQETHTTPSSSWARTCSVHFLAQKRRNVFLCSYAAGEKFSLGLHSNNLFIIYIYIYCPPGGLQQNGYPAKDNTCGTPLKQHRLPLSYSSADPAPSCLQSWRAIVLQGSALEDGKLPLSEATLAQRGPGHAASKALGTAPKGAGS